MPPNAISRAEALKKLAGMDPEELRAMGEAESTTRNKNSRVQFFKDWLDANEEKLPVAPDAVQRFAAFMVSCEYTSVYQYTSSIIMWLCEPVPAGEQQRLLDGPAVLRAIANTEAAIQRTIENHDPKKADPLTNEGRLMQLDKEERKIVLFWYLSGLRGDSYTAIMPEDVTVKTDKIEVRVRNDKIRKQKGRVIAIPCNCSGNGPKKSDFCPMHGARSITKHCFPIKKTKLIDISKKMKLTMHSYRRGLALAVRQEVENGDLAVASKDFAQHMGWEEGAGMWDEYTHDFIEDEEEKRPGWEKKKFIPIAGFKKLWAKTAKKNSHVFKKKVKKSGVKKQIVVSANQKTAKTGKFQTTARRIKTVISRLTKKQLEKSAKQITGSTASKDAASGGKEQEGKATSSKTTTSGGSSSSTTFLDGDGKEHLLPLGGGKDESPKSEKTLAITDKEHKKKPAISVERLQAHQNGATINFPANFAV